MKTKRLSAIYLALALTVAPWHLHAEGLQSVAATNGAATDEASLYADGTRAVNENRWQDAVRLFNRVAQMHGEHAEGALYWKAYAASSGKNSPAAGG
jgi:outer membrane protein assembly factor BamD (BamD/ComL family)